MQFLKTQGRGIRQEVQHEEATAGERAVAATAAYGLHERRHDAALRVYAEWAGRFVHFSARRMSALNHRQYMGSTSKEGTSRPTLHPAHQVEPPFGAVVRSVYETSCVHSSRTASITEWTRNAQEENKHMRIFRRRHLPTPLSGTVRQQTSPTEAICRRPDQATGHSKKDCRPPADACTVALLGFHSLFANAFNRQSLTNSSQSLRTIDALLATVLLVYGGHGGRRWIVFKLLRQLRNA
jgi:hypothetical protein